MTRIGPSAPRLSTALGDDSDFSLDLARMLDVRLQFLGDRLSKAARRALAGGHDAVLFALSRVMICFVDVVSAVYVRYPELEREAMPTRRVRARH